MLYIFAHTVPRDIENTSIQISRLKSISRVSPYWSLLFYSNILFAASLVEIGQRKRNYKQKVTM